MKKSDNNFSESIDSVDSVNSNDFDHYKNGNNVCFSSGPCAKFPGWIPPKGLFAGRSHRSAEALNFIKQTIELNRKILNMPDDYLLGFVNGSSTGAIELLVWNLLGKRGVDVLNQCVFSNHWAHDINELNIPDTRVIYGKFPHVADTSKVDFSKDVVFCSSSTTSGSAFKNFGWIPDDREGLTICDAASAAFIMDLEWTKLDAVACSWQKGIGGEAGLATIILSPRAVERLNNFTPNRAIPRLFRIKENGKINLGIFQGATINTPSMLCIEDYYNALVWAKNIGGMEGLKSRVRKNYDVVARWINSQSVFDFLVDENCRAKHIACFDLRDENYQNLSTAEKWNFLRKISQFCAEKKVGYDILGHSAAAMPNLRIWCGPTVEASDLEKFLPWLTVAYEACRKDN